MTRRVTESCDKCNHKASGKVHKLKMEGQTGITVLGRRLDAGPIITAWECPRCGHPKCISLSLALDPDTSIVSAYEKRYGSADEQAIAALAVMNNQAIAEFGEEWQDLFGEQNVERMIAMIVDGFKDVAGDDWASSLQETGVSFATVEDDSQT